jgi:hypothetical protein
MHPPLHAYALQYVVIALKQGMQVDLIWCDSLQQALVAYAQYYHFLEQDMNRPKRYQPNRHANNTHAQPRAPTAKQWHGLWDIHTPVSPHSEQLVRQNSGTDIHTEPHSRAITIARRCYPGDQTRVPTEAPHTDAHMVDRNLGGSQSGLSTRVHQRNLQMQRQRRREIQESSSDLTQGDDGEPDNTDTQAPRNADVTDGQKQQVVESGTPSSTQQASAPSQILQSRNEGAQPPWRSKSKRMRSDEDIEAQADQAATEIVELVEQEMSSLPSH